MTMNSRFGGTVRRAGGTAHQQQARPGPALKLTKFEAEAVLHQLGQWHRFSGRFDRLMLDDLARDANARARALHQALLLNRTELALQHDELDREILIGVVEDSTWIGAHARESHQKQSAAYAALQSVAEKVERAFQLERRLRVPID